MDVCDTAGVDRSGVKLHSWRVGRAGLVAEYVGCNEDSVDMYWVSLLVCSDEEYLCVWYIGPGRTG